MSTVAPSLRTNTFTAPSDSAGPYDVGFRLFIADALRVYVDGVLEENWTSDSDLTAGYDDAATITFDTAIAEGSVVVIDGDWDTAQSGDLLPSQPNFVTDVNERLTLLTQGLQEAKRDAGRSLRVFDAQEPIDGTSKLIGLDSDGAVSLYSLSLASTATSEVLYTDLAALLASSEASRGVGSVWRAASVAFVEAASGASDQDYTTSGGVKLYKPDVSELVVGARITPQFRTMTNLLAKATEIDQVVAALGSMPVRVLGGRLAGDGGDADLLIVARTGSETTVVQNNLTLAPGYEIIISATSKATWVDKRINAVTVGGRNMSNATQAQSVTANDALLNRMDDLLTDGFTMWFPPGIYWHKQNYADLNNKVACAVIGSGIGVTIFNQADWLDGSNNPKYDDGAGGPNPSIQSNPMIQFYGGSHNRIADIEYNLRWMRIRGFWMRDRYGVIERCKVTESCGRAFAASNETDAEWDTLNSDFGDMTIRDCIAIRSIGTAFSMFGNTRGQLLNNRVEKCWAEGLTTDASDYALLQGNEVKDVCRFDDQAGYPPAGLWDGVAGNGGIGAVGAASCSYVSIIGNIFDGIGQDDPTNTSRDRPFIRWRPRKRDHKGLVIADNHFKDGHVGIHVESLYNVDDVGYTGLHIGSLATITGNTFANVNTNSGQGHIRVDEGCTYITAQGNQADVFPLKIFGAHDITIGDNDGVMHNGSKYISSTCDIQIPPVMWNRKKSDNGADLAEQLNVTGNGTYVTVKYPSLETWSVNVPTYATNGQVTILQDGVYEIVAGAELNNLGTSTSAIIEIQVNSTAKARRKFSFPSGSADLSMGIASTMRCAINDIVRIQVSATGAGADTVDLSARPLTGEFIGRLIL